MNELLLIILPMLSCLLVTFIAIRLDGYKPEDMGRDFWAFTVLICIFYYVFIFFAVWLILERIFSKIDIDFSISQLFKERKL